MRLRHPDARAGQRRDGRGAARSCGERIEQRARPHAAPGRPAGALRRRRAASPSCTSSPASSSARTRPRACACGRWCRPGWPSASPASRSPQPSWRLSGRRRCRRARRAAGASAACRGSRPRSRRGPGRARWRAGPRYQSTSPSSLAIAARRSGVTSPAVVADRLLVVLGHLAGLAGQAEGWDRTATPRGGYSAVRRERRWYSESSTAADPRRRRPARSLPVAAVCGTWRPRRGRDPHETGCAAGAERAVASSSSSSSGCSAARIDGRARARSASRRTTRSSAAAGRAGRCRSTLPRARPRSRCAPSLPWPRRTRPSGSCADPRCVRPPWFSKPASTRAPPRAVRRELDARSRRCRSGAGPSLAHRAHVEQADALGSSRARARRSARAADSRRRRPARRRRARPPRAGPRACARSGPRRTGCWSRSWPPPM